MTDRNERRPGPVTGAAPEYAVGFLLRRAHTRAARAFNEALRPLHIEGRHFAVLEQLAEGPRSQRELGERTGSDKATVVRLVDDLEAAHLVRRDSAPHDRRIRAVTLTDQGATTLTTAQRTAREVAAGLLAHMAPEDRERLAELLVEFLSPPA